ncbi:MAG: hypothetical protein QG580_61 [Patescibacteria group bacterium]|jgi:competence protein ComGC|nr:hypothetical protein [Patescibacteria group bacterium]
MENKSRGLLKMLIFIVILVLLVVFISNSFSKKQEIPVEENVLEVDMSLGEENGVALPQ